MIEFDNKIERSIDLGYKGRGKHIWMACIKCGKERWVKLRKGKPVTEYCCHCFPRIGLHNAWKGGRYKTEAGYVMVWITKDDFFYAMARGAHSQFGGYVLEHRLVMAKCLNRHLLAWEIVHHKNSIKDDNRLENLELVKGRGKHNTLIEKQLKEQLKQIKDLQVRVTLLETENALLKAEYSCA